MLRMPLERLVQLGEYSGLAEGGAGMNWKIELDPTDRVTVRIVRIVRGATPTEDRVIFAWAVEEGDDA
jgi:hypothetical protein